MRRKNNEMTITLRTETVEQAGANPCPPMVVGVGCGGSFEYSAYLAKKALLRPLGSHSNIKHIREMEQEI